jgi:hypothetical protein
MTQSSWLRTALFFTILMIGLLILGGAFAASVGPVELGIWLLVLVGGLALIRLGARRPG